MALPETLPVRVLLGVYLGVLTGILPAFVAWALAVLFRYVTGLTVPAFAVVVLAVALAGVNGGFMALNDPTVISSENSATLVTAVLVVMMMALYAHHHGDAFGATLPRDVGLRALRERTLSLDVVDLVGGRAAVSVVGPVEDLRGYPPLPDDLRAAVAGVEWTFPAHLPLDDLEARFVDRLREEFDVTDADVTVDERGRATVRAAPPTSALSRRVPEGRRAVSVDALLPTGLARGDEVEVHTPEGTVEGRVVSARSGERGPADGEGVAPLPHAPSTTGGEGRLTVAVDRADVEALIRAEAARVVVTARGTGREYELVSLLERAGQRFRRATVRPGGPLDGATIRGANVRDQYGVAVLAVRRAGEWDVAPGGDATLAGGDDLFVAGSRDALAAFEEVAA